MQRGDPTGGCPRGEAALLCSALQVPPAALVGRIRRIVKVRPVGAPLNEFLNDLHPGSLVVGVSCIQAALYAATRKLWPVTCQKDSKNQWWKRCFEHLSFPKTHRVS